MNIDVSLINKRAPYRVNVTDNNNNLDFVTDYGVQYIVGFDKDDTSLSFVTYQFFISIQRKPECYTKQSSYHRKDTPTYEKSKSITSYP